MTLVLIACAVLTAFSLLLAALIRLGWVLRKRRPQRYWRKTLIAHLVLIPLYLLVLVPMLLAWLITKQVGTRGDERGYLGPRIAADGRWIPQDRVSLAADGGGRAGVDPEVLRGARSRAVHFEAQDGVQLRGFLVPAGAPALGVSAVLVHGLFRGALELDPVAAMFHRLGADVLILELRNHGGSARAPASFGPREALDVLAAVDFLRSQPGLNAQPIALFGVSLGTAAAAFAAPQIPGLAGLVLDAPITDLADTATRMLSSAPRRGRRGLGLPAPLRFLILRYAELWSGIDLEQIRPIEALRRLPPDLPSLLIGESEDDRVPPPVVRSAYRALRAPPGVKRLWIAPGSGHGRAWLDHPDLYQSHLAGLLNRVESTRGSGNGPFAATNGRQKPAPRNSPGAGT